MPFINKSIAHINALILSRFEDKRFYGSKLLGLSRLLQVKDSGTIPAIVDASGNGEFSGFDDRYPVVLYHRSLSMTDAQVEELNSFGDGDTMHMAIYRMRCVVYATGVNMTSENLSAMIQSSMRLKLRGDVDGLLEISTDTFSIDLDPVRVFVDEYALSAAEYMLPIQAGYFAINYNLNIKYNTTCVDYCDTCTN